MDPTLSGFQSFIANVMGIPSQVLPSDSVAIQWAFSIALMLVNPDLASVSVPSAGPIQTNAYVQAVYNLAGDNLINFAPDQPGYTYFADLRKSLGINTFAAGVVVSTSDNGDSVSLATPEALKSLTIGNLANLKTPWGRLYLALAQTAGTLWGVA